MAKKYTIRPSKKGKVCDYIKKNFDGYKKRDALDNLLSDKALTFRRWLYYYDYDFLDEVLMEEGFEEKEVDEDNENYGI